MNTTGDREGEIYSVTMADLFHTTLMLSNYAKQIMSDKIL